MEGATKEDTKAVAAAAEREARQDTAANKSVLI